MAYPNLYSDESIVLNAQNVKVKSVSFEAVLTTRRLILVDSKKHLIAPQEILLATLKDIESGENAIRDPTITLSIITTTGATRQMILTFSKLSGGDRHRECDEWIKALKQNVASAGQHPVMPYHTVPEEAYPPCSDDRPSSVRVEPANVPVPPATSTKKKIEIARPGPIKKIVDAPPAIPKPVETSSLPTGSFCNKCGSRVPPDSAFCNKCGTPVVTEAEMEAHVAAASAPAVPQVQVPTPPVFGQGDKKDRPIEEIIHSIEPLIEDSVPRTTPYPLVPKQTFQPREQETAAPAPATDAPAPEAAAPVEPTATPGVTWPVLGSAGGPVENQVSIPAAPAGAPAPAPAAAPLPPVPPSPGRNKKLMVFGAVALVLIVIIAAVFIFANPLGGSAAPATPVPTTVPTTIATPTATPSTPTMTPVPTATTPAVEPTETPAGTTSSGGEIPIPSQNVWVHILYDGEYTGSYGMAGGTNEIAGKGEKLLQIPTNTGIIIASIQKADGSGNKLTVEVWKDGTMVQQRSTTSPKGVVEIQADLRPSPTPTPTPTPTKIPIPTKTAAAANTTANATATETTAA